MQHIVMCPTQTSTFPLPTSWKLLQLLLWTNIPLSPFNVSLSTPAMCNKPLTWVLLCVDRSWFLSQAFPRTQHGLVAEFSSSLMWETQIWVPANAWRNVGDFWEFKDEQEWARPTEVGRPFMVSNQNKMIDWLIDWYSDFCILIWLSYMTWKLACNNTSLNRTTPSKLHKYYLAW